jgi:hypothetical protein
VAGCLLEDCEIVSAMPRAASGVSAINQKQNKSNKIWKKKSKIEKREKKTAHHNKTPKEPS